MTRKQFLILVILVVVSGLVGGTLSGRIFEGEAHAQGIDTLSVRKLIIVDAEGKQRILMGVLKDVAVIAIVDKNNRVRANLAMSPDQGTSLSFSDSDGETRIGVGLHSHGLAEVVIQNKAGEVIWSAP